MTSTSRRGTALLDLPPELLESIMNDLPAKSRARVGVTSKQLRAVTEIPEGYTNMMDEFTKWAIDYIKGTITPGVAQSRYDKIVRPYIRKFDGMYNDLLKEGMNLYYKVNVIRTIPFGELVKEDNLKKIQELLDTTKVRDLNIVILSAYKARVEKEREALLVYKADVNKLMSSLKK